MDSTDPTPRPMGVDNTSCHVDNPDHFLIMIALQSRHRRLDTWKSSTISLLCSGLDPNIQQKIKAAGDPMQTEVLASRVYVRTLKSEDTGDAWRLDAHDSVSR